MLGVRKLTFRKIINLGIIFSFTFTQSCTLSSYGTQEGLLGSLAGAVAGGAAGQIFGDKYGKKTENTALGAGIGALSGVAIGSLIHDKRMESSKEKAQVVRVSREVNAKQKEIDQLREEVYSESSWGRLEVKPWSERYQTETADLPYQGLTLE